MVPEAARFEENGIGPGPGERPTVADGNPNVPAVVKVCSYIVPAPDVAAVAQVVSLGLQNLLSATHAAPLTTL